ncbi:MAG: hypothetical protein FWD29_04525 [Micrococcales bacterium]|nr:hypothetical protein [Micrococcales bacterium]
MTPISAHLGKRSDSMIEPFMSIWSSHSTGQVDPDLSFNRSTRSGQT